MIFKERKIYFTVLLLLPLIIGNSPKLPSFEYKINGNIQRLNGKAKQNFIVTLVAKYSSNQSESVEEFRSYDGPVPGNYVQCITDTSGLFYLDVSTDRKADSLAIKVSSADMDAYISQFISLKYFTQTESYIQVTTGTKPGCLGMGSEPVNESQLDKYIYTFNNYTVNMP